MSIKDEDLLLPPRWLPEQMAECDNCRRVNAPTRSTCLYCGGGLSITSETASLRLPTLVRSLETGQLGFNIVLAANDSPPELDDAQYRKLADLLHLESSQLQAIWQASTNGRKLPLARVPLPDEAALLTRHLAQMGVIVETIPDKILSAESLPPQRMRFFEFTERSLTGRTSSEAEEERLEWPEINLIVVGRVFVRQIEVEERRSRGGPEKELVDARETDSDEILIDIFTSKEDGGWRVAAHSFDFSCLGQSKGFVGAENINKVVGVIRERAVNASFDDGYYRLRTTLEPVWPFEQRTESRGWKRARSGGFSSEAATISTNLSQFTLYSRLRHYTERQRGFRDIHGSTLQTKS